MSMFGEAQEIVVFSHLLQRRVCDSATSPMLGSALLSE